MGVALGSAPPQPATRVKIIVSVAISLQRVDMILLFITFQTVELIVERQPALGIGWPQRGMPHRNTSLS